MLHVARDVFDASDAVPGRLVLNAVVGEEVGSTLVTTREAEETTKARASSCNSLLVGGLDKAGRGKSTAPSGRAGAQTAHSRKPLSALKVDQVFESLPLGLGREPFASDTLDCMSRDLCCI